MSSTTPLILSAYVGTYATVEDAQADYDAVKELHSQLGGEGDVDAAVISKDSDGSVHIKNQRETPTNRETLEGAGIGLAAGLVAALFPAIALTGGLIAGTTIGGAAIGAVAGHVSKGMSRGDLKDLGEQLDAGTAGLVVMASTELGPKFEAAMTRADKVSRRELNHSTS